MKTLIAMTLFGAAFAISAGASPADPPKLKDKSQVDPAVLEGGYRIISSEKDGKSVPKAEIKGFIVSITRDSIVGTDKDLKELYVSDYTIDSTKTPWKIDMKSLPGEKPFPPSGLAAKEGSTVSGIVKKEGRVITLVYALPGGDAPTEFKTKMNQQMFVMRSGVDDNGVPNKFQEGP